MPHPDSSSFCGSSRSHWERTPLQARTATRLLEPGAHGLQKWPEYTRHSANVNRLTFHFSLRNFMKYATFSLPSDVVPRLGVVRGDRMIDTSTLPPGDWHPPATLLELIQQGPDAWSADARTGRSGSARRAGTPSPAFAGTRRSPGRSRTSSALGVITSLTPRKLHVRAGRK